MKMEGFPTQPTTPPAEKDQELEDVKKEMHMSGRAMRVDETPEEYKAEREQSWAEKQARATQPENVTEDVVTNKEEKPPISAGEQKINEYVNRIKSGESKDSIFQGLPESFKSRIEDKLTAITEESEIEIAKEERRRVDEKKLAEIRASLGLESETPIAPEKPTIDIAVDSSSDLEMLKTEKDIGKKVETETGTTPENSEQTEKYKELHDQMEQLIEYAWKIAQEGSKGRGLLDFKGFLERGAFANTMYESIHSQNSPSHKEMYEKYFGNPDFKNFDETISDKLVSAVSGSSKVRHITPKELIDGGQPDQAAGFVWFKGNAPRPANAREVRFYVNTKPEGVVDTATHLAKISDLCDQYGLRLQYKFRKELDRYDRSDTCVVYLYIPEAKTGEQQKNSDNWLKFVASEMAKIPKEDVRANVSLFTEKVADGVAYIEDSRSKDSKSGESYTSQISQMMGGVALEYASKYKNPTPDMLPNIVNEALERLKKIGY